MGVLSFRQGKKLPPNIDENAEEGDVSDEDSADEMEDDCKLMNGDVSLSVCLFVVVLVSSCFSGWSFLLLAVCSHEALLSFCPRFFFNTLASFKVEGTVFIT